MEKKGEKKKKALEEEMLDEVNGGGTNYIVLFLNSSPTPRKA